MKAALATSTRCSHLAKLGRPPPPSPRCWPVRRSVLVSPLARIWHVDDVKWLRTLHQKIFCAAAAEENSLNVKRISNEFRGYIFNWHLTSDSWRDKLRAVETLHPPNLPLYFVEQIDQCGAGKIKAFLHLLSFTVSCFYLGSGRNSYSGSNAHNCGFSGICLIPECPE